MSCPDPYRPYNPFEEEAPTPDAAFQPHGDLPSDSEIRSLTSALAASGGRETSEDLALDLVLNQIVEQACLATGATGAAIALTRNGEMVCRATTGRTAPDLGIRLDNAGFSAECLRVGTLQRCDDTETDPRVDPAACRLLGVRSILVVPLWYWGEFMGIFEIFSPRANAFGERDEQTLQALAYRVVRHTKETSGRLAGFTAGDPEMAAVTAPQPEVEPEVEPEPAPEPEPPEERPRPNILEIKFKPSTRSNLRDRWMVFLVASASLIACVIVGLMIFRLLSPTTAARKSPPPALTTPASEELELAPLRAAAAAPEPAPVPQTPKPAPPVSRKPVSASDVVISASKKETAPTPVAGLAIYEKGKLIYGTPLPDSDQPEQPAAPKVRSPRTVTSVASKSTQPLANSRPADAQPTLMDGRFVRLKPETAEALLAERVEPEYPDAARRSHVQGSVTLETLISASGRVQEVTPVSGNPQLADAAVSAVRQWRYKPFTVDGKKVPIRTQVTVNFMLAQ